MLPELIGRAVCAQDPTHTLPGVAHALPVCARCAAMHLAVAAGWFAWPQRPRAAAQGSWPASLLVGGVLLLPMAIDVAGGVAGLWDGSGWTRAATGLLGGLGVALLLLVGGALTASDSAMPRPDPRRFLTSLAAAVAALLLAGLAPPAAGGWIAAAAVIASASLTIGVALRAVAGGSAPASRAQRGAAVAIALVLLVLIGRAR